jgi:DNA-binding CsgD family transcriptional regulator
MAPLSRLPPGAFSTSRDLVADEVLLANRGYREHFVAHGIRDIAGLVLQADRERLTLFSLLCAEPPHRPSTRMRRLLERLAPHLQRAVALAQRFDEAREATRLAEGALEVLSVGVLALDAGGRILHANEQARRILEAGDALFDSPGGVRGIHASDTQRLRAALRRVAAGDAPQGEVVRLERVDGAPYAAIVRSPAQLPADGALIRARCAAVVFLLDPDHGAAPSLSLLTHLYGLTPAEARLAVALASGETLAEIAEGRGLRKSTVRTQLLGVFAKTGTDRQSALVGLLSRLGLLPQS